MNKAHQIAICIFFLLGICTVSKGQNDGLNEGEWLEKILASKRPFSYNAIDDWDDIPLFVFDPLNREITIWADGRIAWRDISKHRNSGFYFKSKISKSDIDKTLQTLETAYRAVETPYPRIPYAIYTEKIGLHFNTVP